LDALLGVVSSFFAVFLFESLAIFWFPCFVSFFLFLLLLQLLLCSTGFWRCEVCDVEAEVEQEN
jgi:hypothetical protein